MRAPDVIFLSPVAGNLAHSETVPIADDVVIGNGVDRVARLPFPMHLLQKRDRSKAAGRVVDNNVVPASRPIDGAGNNCAAGDTCSNEKAPAIHRDDLN